MKLIHTVLISFCNFFFFQQSASAEAGTGTHEANAASAIVRIAVLPLQWGDINAVRQDAGIVVHFTCYNIASVDDFQLQRSKDGVQWQTVAAINQPATGNHSFELFDIEATDQNLYYRIASSDTDGKVYFSKMIVAEEARFASGITPPQHRADLSL